MSMGGFTAAKSVFNVGLSYYDYKNTKKDADRAKADLQDQQAYAQYEIERGVARDIKFETLQSVLLQKGYLSDILIAGKKIDMYEDQADLFGDAVDVLISEKDIKMRDLEKDRQRAGLHYVKSGIDMSGSALLVLDEIAEDNRVELKKMQLSIRSKYLDQISALTNAEITAMGAENVGDKAKMQGILFGLAKEDITATGKARLLDLNYRTSTARDEINRTVTSAARNVMTSVFQGGSDTYTAFNSDSLYKEYGSDVSSTDNASLQSSTSSTSGAIAPTSMFGGTSGSGAY